MSSLRWILLAAGAVLLLGIVFWDRLRRPASQVDDRPRTDERSRPVPQLDEAIAVRSRGREHVAPPMVVANRAPLDSDALPPMHAIENPSVEVTRDHQAVETAGDRDESIAAPRVEPVVDRLSTGAFIAAQAMSTQSMRAAMHEAQHAPVQSPIVDVDQAPEQRPSVEAHTDDVAERTTSTPRSIDVSAEQARQTRIPRRPPSSRKIVALRLSAGATKVEGAHLKSVLEEAGLRHGKYGIYHRIADDGTTLFSVASMVEPGTFDPYAMAGLLFPGVTLFMQLPGEVPGDEKFTQLLACARQIEQAIGGQLRDERGVVLDEQREQRVRDEIADFEHLVGGAHG